MPKKSSAKQDHEELVVDYLKTQNRPFNVQMLFMNLHKAVGKTALQKLLDDLVSRGELTSKTFGKSSLYWYNQDNLPVPDEDQLQQIDQEIASLKETKNELSQQLSTMSSEVSSLKNSLSDEDLATRIAELEKENEDARAKLEELSKGDALVSDERKRKVTQIFDKGMVFVEFILQCH